jgi:hypothetical protein
MIYFSKKYDGCYYNILAVSGMFFMIFFVIVNSPDQIKWCYITSHPVSLQIPKKCCMASDMKLTVDKVVVNAQLHVHGYGNIKSITW